MKEKGAYAGEKINIVAHSHGGNVVKKLTELAGEGKVSLPQNIDTAVNLGTPQRSDYKFDRSQVENVINIYTKEDVIQRLGGKLLGTGGQFDQQADVNIDATQSLSLYNSDSSPYRNFTTHSTFHDNLSFWKNELSNDIKYETGILWEDLQEIGNSP